MTDLPTHDELRTRLFLLQPTPFCNLNCRYCYLPHRNHRNRMTLETFETAMRRLMQSGLLKDKASLAWHCGEPLAVGLDYYHKAYDLAKKLETEYDAQGRLSYGLQTNGVLLNDQWCEFFAEQNFVIGLSLDGPAFLHDKNRVTLTGKGSSDLALRGLERLKQHGVKFTVICVLTADALQYPQEIHDFFAKHCEGMAIGFNIDEADGSNAKSTFEQGNIDSRYRGFLEKFYGLVQASGAFTVREFEHKKSLILGYQSLKYSETRPFTVISVNHKGDFATFSPELLDQKSDCYGSFNLGNVHEIGFLESMETAQFAKMYSDVVAGVQICRDTCQYFRICGATCLSNKVSENGSFRSAETQFCRLQKQAIADTVISHLEAASHPAA